MAKTVIEYVQYCLTTMDSDQVDAIAETEESMQVAELLKEVYYEFINRDDWPWLERGLQVAGAGDTTNPTKLILPDNVKDVLQLRYKREDGKLQQIKYLAPSTFLDHYGNGQNRDSDLEVQVQPGLTVFVGTEKDPDFWTSFDDDIVICNSYNSDRETTLNGSNVSSWGSFIPEFQVSDLFEPTIPRHLEPTLQAHLNEAAHIYYKQQESSPDQQRALRQMSQARRNPASTQPGTPGFFRNQSGRE